VDDAEDRIDRLGLPHIVFDGDDRAVATCHAQLLLRDPGAARELL